MSEKKFGVVHFCMVFYVNLISSVLIINLLFTHIVGWCCLHIFLEKWAKVERTFSYFNESYKRNHFSNFQ